MLLRCNLCIQELRDEASKKTDVLWLRTIKGVDFLVCKFHRRDYYREQKPNSQRVVPSIPATV